MQEFRVDMRQMTPEEMEQGKRDAQLVFELNHTMPFTERYGEIINRGRRCRHR